MMFITKECKWCNNQFEVPHFRVNANFCSRLCANKNTANNQKGVKRTQELKEKVSNSIKIQFKNGRNAWNKNKKGLQVGRKGKKCNWWKGGTTSLWQKIINSEKYANWRNSVYIRDKYTCQKCKNTGNKLAAHHIKAKSIILREFIEVNNNKNIKFILNNCNELFNINNGITLCNKCHYETDNYAGKLKLINKIY